MRRSQLYVPANNEKMIRKIPQLEADSFILDLEDSVPTPEKARARGMLAELLDTLDVGSRELCIRINPLDTPESSEDVREVAKLQNISALVVPKAEDPRRLRELQIASGKNLIPLIETPKGILASEDIARVEGVVALSYGPGDLALSMHGAVKTYEENIYVKTLVVVAARANGLDPIDKVFFDLTDQEGFRNEATKARDLGYAGKQVIHPSQIAIANTIFSPSAEELEWARTVIAAYDAAAARGIGAIRVDDMLVDSVHYRIAKSLLEGT